MKRSALQLGFDFEEAPASVEAPRADEPVRKIRADFTHGPSEPTVLSTTPHTSIEHARAMLAIVRKSLRMGAPPAPTLEAHYQAIVSGGDLAPRPARPKLVGKPGPIRGRKVAKLNEERCMRVLGFDRATAPIGAYPIDAKSDHGVCLEVLVGDLVCGLWVARSRVTIVGAD